jgi:osomolarity two-component system, sensor histidine kinase NIK1
MGGHIWVASDVGHGSEFHFSCIAKYATDEISVISSQLYPFRKRKVLVIDSGISKFFERVPSMIEELTL